MKKAFQICFVLALFSNLATAFGQKSGTHYNRRQPETGASGSAERSMGEVVISGTPYSSNKTNTSALQPSSTSNNSSNGTGGGNKPTPKPTPKKVTTTSGCAVGIGKAGPLVVVVPVCGQQKKEEY